MNPIEGSRRIHCAASRQQMWLALVDTHRFARALGGAAVTFEPLQGAGASRFLSTTKISGLEIRYEERPFEWRAPEWLLIRRTVRTGPAAAYELELNLKPTADGGCDVDFRLASTPRSTVVWPLVRVRVAVVVRKSARLIARISENLVAGRPAYGEDSADAVNRDALALATTRLADLCGDAALAGKLAEHVALAPEIDAAHIRPYELAECWQAERRSVLALCLHAVTAGLLELKWQIVCPSCRVGVGEVGTLAALGNQVHCHMCDLTAALDFEQSLEAVFRPAPAVRRVASAPYCISGPFRMPHVVAQTVLPGGGRTTLIAPAQPGRYRLFARGGAVATVIVEAGASAVAELRAGQQLVPAQLCVGPGAELRLEDAAASERHVKLERLDWAGLGATAFEVSTLPGFRDRFSAQVLTAGRSLAITRATFVVTDLVGSTLMYSQLGDAAAYRLIQDHLDLLDRVVAEHTGSVVKTLGDSVLAVFPDERRGVEAARAMQRVHAEATFLDGLPTVGLRIGVFSGPCYAITANRALDYFGLTVNCAQRLAALARAGEIVLPETLAKSVIPDVTVTREAGAVLKGVPAPLDIARIPPP